MMEVHFVLFLRGGKEWTLCFCLFSGRRDIMEFWLYYFREVGNDEMHCLSSGRWDLMKIHVSYFLFLGGGK